MTIEQRLVQRFKKAIRKSLPQCPIIGDKWFRYNESGKPAHFQFVAMNRLVKATGIRAETLARRIERNLDLHGFDAALLVTKRHEFRITLKGAAALDGESKK